MLPVGAASIPFVGGVDLVDDLGGFRIPDELVPDIEEFIDKRVSPFPIQAVIQMSTPEGEWKDIGRVTEVSVPTVEGWIEDPRACELLYGEGVGRPLGIFKGA